MTSPKLKVPSPPLSSLSFVILCYPISKSETSHQEKVYQKPRNIVSKLSVLPSFLFPYYMTLMHVQEAMHNFIHEMLHDSPAAQPIDALWRVSSSYLLSRNVQLESVDINSRSTKRVKGLKPNSSKACCPAFSLEALHLHGIQLQTSTGLKGHPRP